MNQGPDFFLVGAPKCGTSAMATYLAAHPDIFMPDRKEMHVFGGDLRFGPQWYRRSLDSYLAQYEARNGKRRAGEASVWYLFSEQAAAEIKAFNPQARILIMLREPAEMLYSLYYQFRFDGNEPLASFEQALAAEPARRAGCQLSRMTYFPQGLLYRDVACYTLQVKRYFDLFGRERVQVLIYDDFVANPQSACRSVFDFLEVDAAFRPETQVVNANKFIKHSGLRAMLNDPWVRSAVLSIRPLLPSALFDALHRIEERLRRSNTRVEKRPPLTPALRERLQTQFAPEVRRLSALLGRDLSHWSRPAAQAGGARPSPGTAMSANRSEPNCPDPARSLETAVTEGGCAPLQICEQGTAACRPTNVRPSGTATPLPV